MSHAVSTDIHAPSSGTNYLNNGYGLRSWLLTRDHKRIAILYLLSVTLFFFIGGIMAMLIRLELLTPEGDLLQADTYNRVFSMHGISMVFFFLIPAIPAVLGNFLVPLMIGAKDLAFPRINLLSWYLYMFGGAFTLWAMIHGGVDTGWTFYTPLSTHYAQGQVMMAALGVFIAGFSSILTGLNFVVTIHRMRAPGMTWFRLPLFIWSHYATSLIMLLGTPVIAVTILMLAAERAFHLGLFDPRLGGDPVLFQHLFWFYSHPAVYIMVLPAMGVVSELIAAFSRKPVFGYKIVAIASIAIAVLGFLVWGHHMFVSGQSIYTSTVFSILSMLVAIPSAV
ncbi:MAG TPA: cbb3-type cytochrome c oxidase subunit I, partial [Thermoanaerobaculia bacterium]|nr:cbb3-type cytochrome c oxidase subunit I [Thermoanaerobaculia bacterium]